MEIEVETHREYKLNRMLNSLNRYKILPVIINLIVNIVIIIFINHVLILLLALWITFYITHRKSKEISEKIRRAELASLQLAFRKTNISTNPKNYYLLQELIKQHEK